ncbi:MAG: hypothetical protein K9N23_17025 [Akkermansiaceae bacterium]|nr:hypothetical protein [Akkermansiaceae bacterium]MCF7733396.1 hypothetical protein [Akkermansiaceae bacterium]
MNALVSLKSALRDRSGFIFNVLATVTTAVLLGACASSSDPSAGYGAAPGSTSQIPWNSASSPGLAAAPARAADAKVRSGSAVAESEAFAKPTKERPGLATQWGGSVKSVLSNTSFARASTKPHGVDAIYYNDSAGLKAMGVKDMRVAGMQQAAGGVLEWGIRGGFSLLTAYKSYGNHRRYVEGRNGSTYSIVVKNRCKSRILVVLSVDGLDVMDGKPAGTSRPGYVINAGETLEVKGFRTSHDAVAAFKFSTVSQSYANTRHGDTRNVGVIGLAAFLEKGRDPWTWMPDEIQKRETATPFATAR